MIKNLLGILEFLLDLNVEFWVVKHLLEIIAIGVLVLQETVEFLCSLLGIVFVLIGHTTTLKLSVIHVVLVVHVVLYLLIRVLECPKT